MALPRQFEHGADVAAAREPASSRHRSGGALRAVDREHRPTGRPYDRDAINDIYRAIHQLRPTERALILLHLDGLSYGEIADTLGTTANAVGSRLTRARDTLAKSLKGNLHHHERI